MIAAPGAGAAEAGDGRALSLKKRRVTLITGASSGIGACLARVFARNGHELALIARSQDKLKALAFEIAASGQPMPLVLPFDLTEKGAADAVAEALDSAGASLEILVNNAGFGLAGETSGLSHAEQLELVDLNVRATLDITLRFLPAIRAAKGKILNVASTAAYFPGGPSMAAYYASKAFLLSFSLALHQELRREGVAVSALCPGYTRTGFQARAGFGADMWLTRLPGSTAMDVAEAGYAGLIAGKREIIPGFFNKLSVLVLPFVPKAVILPLISQMQQNRLREADARDK